jgi:signal transduction histidine kinase
MAEPEKKETGRVVYSRLPGAGDADGGASQAVEKRKAEERRASSSAAARGVEQPSLVPTLLALLVGFTLLLALVFLLGTLSVGRLQTISTRSLEEERRYNDTVNVLLKLRNALYNLDNEARIRGRIEAGTEGVLQPPGQLRLRKAQGEIKELLPFYDRLPLAQTEKGAQFRRDFDEYLAITGDSTRYNLEGFESFRKVEPQLSALLAETGEKREAVTAQRDDSLERAKQAINLLKWLAALTGFVVAAGTIWEVQRRFRQLRRSLVEVRRERQFNAQMLEGMVSAIAAIDGEDRLRSANAAFFELFPEAEAGASVHEQVATPEAGQMLRAAVSTRVERATYRGRWLLPGASGGNGSAPKQRSFDVYSSPLEIDGSAGQLLALVDVTEAAEAETELRRQESLAAVGQAAAQVAHEIKNPLGSIRLGVAMLRDMTEDREAITTIDLVERGIDHLSKLTLDVTQFSRRRQLTLAETDLHELLDASLDLVADKIREKRTLLEKRLSAEPLTGRWDEDLLRQVFVNLLANAIDASPEGAPVALTTERIMADLNVKSGEGRVRGAVACARISVTDRGAGMDEATRERIFEPFFTTKKKGTGLGLAIAKQIVEQHGGRITVTSGVGEGTTFTVDLPLAPDATTAAG